GRVTERAGPGEHVGERIPRRLDREPLPATRRHRDIEVARVGRDPLDRSALPPELAADDAHARAIIVGAFRDRARPNVLVTRIRHLERRWEVGPELKAVHAASLVALRHLLMEDPAAGGHPLHVSRGHPALIAETIAVLY